MSLPGGISLFLGPDRSAKLQRLHELERSLKIQPTDSHRLQASPATGAELLALCRQQPLESPVRLVVVDEAHRLNAASVAALLERAPAIGQVTRLILLVETELSLRHELAKPHPEITVERFPAAPEAPLKPFALTEALGAGDAAAALRAAQDQLRAGREPLELVGLVAWQVQRWVTVKRLLDAGSTLDGIVSSTGFKLWQVQRLQSEVERRPLTRLQRELERCWELDVDAKRGRTSPELAIEQLILEVCLS
jgi:DNA polymerase III delta subunit